MSFVLGRVASGGLGSDFRWDAWIDCDSVKREALAGSSETWHLCMDPPGVYRAVEKENLSHHYYLLSIVLLGP